MRVEIVKRYAEGGRSYWWVRVRASNGQVLASSETYKTRRAARRCAALLAGGARGRAIEWIDAGPPASRTSSGG